MAEFSQTAAAPLASSAGGAGRDRPGNEEPGNRAWTFITNHAAVLLYVSRHPTATVRDIGDAVGIRERSAARILRELRDEGYIDSKRSGRRNVYAINLDRPLKHPLGGRRQVSDLLQGLTAIDELAPTATEARGP